MAAEEVIYYIETKVMSLTEEFGSSYMGGYGKDAIFHKYSKGWFVHFEGSWEKLFLGIEKPMLQVGDTVNIIFRRKANALPSQPPV